MKFLCELNTILLQEVDIGEDTVKMMSKTTQSGWHGTQFEEGDIVTIEMEKDDYAPYMDLYIHVIDKASGKRHRVFGEGITVDPRDRSGSKDRSGVANSPGFDAQFDELVRCTGRHCVVGELQKLTVAEDEIKRIVDTLYTAGKRMYNEYREEQRGKMNKRLDHTRFKSRMDILDRRINSRNKFTTDK